MELGVDGEQGPQSLRHPFPLLAGLASLANFFFAPNYSPFFHRAQLLEGRLGLAQGEILIQFLFSLFQSIFPGNFLYSF